MSANRELPHVRVLPEDEANRQIVAGFLTHPHVRIRKIDPLRSSGGWNQVLESFKKTHIGHLDKYPNAYMILLIDFDSSANRRATAEAVLPERLRARVFVLGSWTGPERLKDGWGSYEQIGKEIADACFRQDDAVWEKEQLNTRQK